jgi:hypothetical protein
MLIVKTRHVREKEKTMMARPFNHKRHQDAERQRGLGSGSWSSPSVLVVSFLMSRDFCLCLCLVMAFAFVFVFVLVFNFLSCHSVLCLYHCRLQKQDDFVI